MKRLASVADAVIVGVASLTACDPTVSCPQGQRSVDMGSWVQNPGHYESTTIGTGKSKRPTQRYVQGSASWRSHWVCL